MFDMKKYQKEYRETHKEKRKEYILNNRDVINSVRKQYRHDLGISKRYYNGIRKVKIYSSRGNKYDENWPNLRKIIYKRDNWICQKCGVKCHCNGTKDKIQCHHIDYNINNNNQSNLITLCASCHMKTNFNKKDWKDYFQNQVSKTMQACAT